MESRLTFGDLGNDSALLPRFRAHDAWTDGGKCTAGSSEMICTCGFQEAILVCLEGDSLLGLVLLAHVWCKTEKAI